MKRERTIVCMVSQQNVPNYCFVKEMYRPGDEILLIVTSKMQQQAQYLEDGLGWSNAHIRKHTFAKEGLEDNWQLLLKELKPLFQENRQYIVNLTGGTKMMMLAVHECLNDVQDKELYYMPYGRDTIHSFSSKDVPITTQLTLDDYFILSGKQIKHDKHGCLCNKEQADKIFHTFTHTPYDDKVRDALLFLIEKPADGGKSPRNKTKTEITNIPNSTELFQYFGYIPQNKEFISKEEVQYITGGWFEEWTYYNIKDYLNLDDKYITIGGTIISGRKGVDGNELDVSFVYHNSLYVIECKSGISKLSALRDYLDKLKSIESNFNTLTTNGFLFGIASDDNSWKEASEYEGIKYLSKEDLMDEKKRFSFIK